jgi:hypothetical protein
LRIQDPCAIDQVTQDRSSIKYVWVHKNLTLLHHRMLEMDDLPRLSLKVIKKEPSGINYNVRGYIPGPSLQLELTITNLRWIFSSGEVRMDNNRELFLLVDLW